MKPKREMWDLKVVGFGWVPLKREWQLRRLVEKTFEKFPIFGTILNLYEVKVYSPVRKIMTDWEEKEIRKHERDYNHVLAFLGFQRAESRGTNVWSPLNPDILAHEFGHVFDLYHPCGGICDSCNEYRWQSECREFETGNLMCKVHPNPSIISDDDLAKLRRVCLI